MDIMEIRVEIIIIQSTVLELFILYMNWFFVCFVLLTE